jgi:endonuclease/exonuclease/phosphatase family metal-dependent hydrolase
MVVRILNLLVFPLTLVTGLLLGASMLSPFVHPSISSWFQVLGLAFPMLFLINLLFLLYWWLQLRLKLIFPLCMAILGLNSMSKYAQYTGEHAAPSSGPVKVGSVNAQLFGAYQNRWFFDTVADVLKAKNLDVVCLQEVYAKKDLEGNALKLRRKAGFKHHILHRLVPERNYGMMILSRHPIVGSGRVDFPGNTGNMAIFADLLMGEDTIRVYNVHLQSIRFRKTDYDFVNGSDNPNKSNLEQGKGLLRRMRDAYEKRASQSEAVAAHLKNATGVQVVCGDFNDVPLSYAYRTVSEGLHDAFREAGSGIERTYLGPFPSFRIDYILFSKNMACSQYSSTSEIPGDHKLILADLYLRKKP